MGWKDFHEFPHSTPDGAMAGGFNSRLLQPLFISRLVSFREMAKLVRDEEPGRFWAEDVSGSEEVGRCFCLRAAVAKK